MQRKINILYVGHLLPGQTSRMRMEALQALGHTVFAVDTQSLWLPCSIFSRLIQQKASLGPIINNINQSILQIIKTKKIDLLWCDKQEYIQPEIIQECKKKGILTVHYTPDPYFYLSWKQTLLSKQVMPLYDLLITSKAYELDDYKNMNPRTIYMPLGFSEHVHRPYIPSEKAMLHKYSSDVSFIGGWEPRREEFLAAVSWETSNLKIWGHAWDHLKDGKKTLRRYVRLKRLAGKEKFEIKKNKDLVSSIQGGEIYGNEYAQALSCSKISLGFLRTTWPDQHTTRTFEIPACGAMLLADRTKEHQELFKEGIEADYFSSKEELIDKIRYYLKNEVIRQAIAKAGYERCFRSGYSYGEILKHVCEQLLKKIV